MKRRRAEGAPRESGARRPRLRDARPQPRALRPPPAQVLTYGHRKPVEEFIKEIKVGAELATPGVCRPGRGGALAAGCWVLATAWALAGAAPARHHAQRALPPPCCPARRCDLRTWLLPRAS